ncbi:tetratricopeptide repeat protein [Actinopolyspora lacussalsi]
MSRHNDSRGGANRTGSNVGNRDSGNQSKRNAPRRADRSGDATDSRQNRRSHADRNQNRRDTRADSPHGNAERTRGDSGKRTPSADPGRPRAPKLPEEANASQLDPEVRRDFRALPKMVAEDVGAHVVAVGMLLEQEPEKALEHARYARRKASRSPAAREANGLAAYYVGNWSEALSELRAARRMGGQSHLAIIADCERALGKPQRALELTREDEATRLPQDEAIELRIVGAGARRDLGQSEAAVVSLQIPELDPQRNESWSARLFYAYADNLLAVGRTREAFTWFVHAANADDDEVTDAPERLEELVTELGGPEEAERLAARAETDTAVSEVSEGTVDTDLDHGTGDSRADRRSAGSHDINLGVWD